MSQPPRIAATSSPLRSLSLGLTLAAAAIAAGAAAGVASGLSGRVPAAMAAEPAGAAMLIATADVYKVSARLVSTEAFVGRMEAKRDELRKRIEPMDKDIKAITEKLKALGPDNKSPEAQQTAELFQARQQDILKLSQGLDREMDTFVTAINFEAYLTVVKQAQAVAKAKGFAYLVASRPSDDTTPPTSAGAFMQSVMSRPMLLAPAGTDLTADVFASMKLEENPAAASAPGAGPAATPAGTPGVEAPKPK